MSEPIRLLIADDHALVREGLRALIEFEPGMELVGEAVDGQGAIELARELRPDVILLDIVMPQLDGIEAIAAIREEDPGARILVITSFAEDEKVFAAIKRGALGYLLKDASPQELLQAVRDVQQGEPSMSSAIAHKLMRELQRSQRSDLPPTEDPLSERELEVLRWVAQGLSNQDIAEALTVSERTIRAHVSSILGKLHLANRTQAALYALREGLAPLE